VVGVGLGVPAAAHADLVSSDPADGAILATAPSAITLTFSDPLFVDGVQMSLVTEEGTVVPSDPPTVDETTASLPWPAAAGPGSYEVGFRVVSADGHPVSGAISFTVQAGAAEATAAQTTATEPASQTETTDPTMPVSPLILGAALLAALAVAIAGAIAFGRRKR
jgi:methionine-rich copper-binding protein CopC